jgi:hypothetical protein
MRYIDPHIPMISRTTDHCPRTALSGRAAFSEQAVPRP